MRILICTGIYPPEIGGPAEYAKNLALVWEKQGYAVDVKVFGKFRKFPWGVRHVLFFFYVIPSVAKADYIFTLEAFSSGITALASKIFLKKVVYRTGGDLLWESYIERTGEMVLLKDFYNTKINNLSKKEKLIFHLVKWTLKNISGVIWSTEWQKNISIKPYELERQKHFIVENYYGKKDPAPTFVDKNFVASSRGTKLKNLDALEEIFKEKDLVSLGLFLDTKKTSHDELIERVKNCYAVIVASISEVSPNTVIDAITYGKPFVVTREVGIYDRIKNVAIFIDPQDKYDMLEKVLWLGNEENYKAQKNKVEAFDFQHSWEEIASEYIKIYNSLV